MTLLVILAAAVFYDVREERVPNPLIVTGLVITAGHAFYLGWLPEWLLGIGIPVLILFPLFMIRAIGAGDIKLLCVTGGYIGWRAVCFVIIVSFFAGAVLSVMKILKYHQFLDRMRYLAEYISICNQEKKIRPYYKKEEGSRKERIHFTVPILFACLWYLGGII